MDQQIARPLAGIRVLSFAQMLMGSAAVQYLADLGADVIKVENPGKGAWERNWAGADAFRGEVSLFFLLANRNQRGVTLNLKHPASRDVVWRLLATTDVLVENYRPGVMDRLGLGYEQLREEFPRLVYVSASGYGQTGPYRDRPGQDLLLQALSGLASITGSARALPTPAGSPIVDQHAASLIAMAVLAALLLRDRTGDGRLVEVSLLRAALDLQQEPFAYHMNGFPFTRPTSDLASGIHPAPYGIYATADGNLVLSLSPISQLCEVPDFAPLSGFGDDEQYTRRDEIRHALEPIIKGKTTAEWVQQLSERGIWCGPVNDYEGVLADPQVQHLDPTIEFDYPADGSVRVFGLPFSLAGYEPPTRRPPLLGEHTDDVLREIGLKDDAIGALRQEGAI